MGRSGVVEKNICQNICPKGKVELREGKIHASIITIQDETICKKMPSVEASYKWILQMMQVPEDPKAVTSLIFWGVPVYVVSHGKGCHAFYLGANHGPITIYTYKYIQTHISFA